MTDRDDGSVPMVPFVPFRCPRCGRHKPRTENVRGRLRDHRCMACGQKYRSLEAAATDVRGYERGSQGGGPHCEEDG